MKSTNLFLSVFSLIGIVFSTTAYSLPATNPVECRMDDDAVLQQQLKFNTLVAPLTSKIAFNELRKMIRTTLSDKKFEPYFATYSLVTKGTKSNSSTKPKCDRYYTDGTAYSFVIVKIKEVNYYCLALANYRLKDFSSPNLLDKLYFSCGEYRD